MTNNEIGSKASIEKVVATSGYFDPLHIGHIRCFNEAKKLGTKLVVILNTDDQAKQKKGFSFMSQEERKEIIENLASVDEVIYSIDTDTTQCKTLEMLKPNIFAKGGDRYIYEIPEAEICRKNNIVIVDGIGGNKIQSSSWLINNAEKRNNLCGCRWDVDGESASSTYECSERDCSFIEE